jgi:hypothetical protein
MYSGWRNDIFDVMKVRRATALRETWSILALLWALMLPLQGFAAAEHCEGSSGQHAKASLAHSPATAHEHCPPHERAPHRDHHGCCSDCCLTAVAASTLAWTPARLIAPALFLPAPRAPLTLSLDRLDRPPRRFA